MRKKLSHIRSIDWPASLMFLVCFRAPSVGHCLNYIKLPLKMSQMLKLETFFLTCCFGHFDVDQNFVNKLDLFKMTKTNNLGFKIRHFIFQFKSVC